MKGTALRDGAVQEVLGQRRIDEVHHACGTGGLPGDGDAAGVATECGDVASYPLQGRDLIEQAVVAHGARGGAASRDRLLQEFAGREEAEDSTAVVEGDDYDAGRRERRTIEGRVASVSGDEPTAVDPHQDGPSFVVDPRGPYVHGEAVLTHRERPGPRVLRADRAESDRVPHARPGRGRLRWAPSILTGGARGVRDAAEDRDTRLCG